MGIVAEFKKFGAELKNPNWSVSSINSKRELVVSLWGHSPLFKKHPTERKQIYKDNINRWSGNGRNEFKINLNEAFSSHLRIRTVLAILKNSEDFKYILDGKDGSKFSKNFYAKTTWIGELILWDGENFEIEFCLEP